MRAKTVVPGLAALAAAVTVLAGCDAVTVNRSEISDYTGSFYVQTTAQNGVNSVIVRNSPFPPQAVVDALQSRYQSGQYKFGPGPNPPGWNGYTVVFSFGGPTIGGKTLCQNLNTPQVSAPSDHTEVLGEYCYGDRLVTQVIGRAPPLSGPQDPHFQQLAGAMVAELFRNDYNIYHKSGGNGTPH